MISKTSDSTAGDEPMIVVRDTQLYPLVVQVGGPHVFGGRASHRGTTPPGSNVAVHKLLTIDLRDDTVPFASSAIRFLPLYHPLQYGAGGASMQYSIVSEDEIRITHISPPEADPPDERYVKVDAFPEIRYAASPPISDDDPIDWFTLTLGGSGTLDHKSDPCQNGDCPNYRGKPDVDLLASIPPKPIPGHKDVWWEFEGAYMLFYFWLCRGCGSILTSNRCT